MWQEFRTFAMRGNVMDMAIGIILGSAFGNVVSSLVRDVLMPPIGLLVGRVDTSQLYVNLSGRTFSSLSEAQQAGVPTIHYGQFLTTTVDFIIVAFAVFLIVRGMNRLRRDEVPSPTARSCPYCLSTVPRAATRCPQCTSDLEAP